MAAAIATSAPATAAQSLAATVMKLDRQSPWRMSAAIPVRFHTFHPQGMARVGDTFFVSSVEVLRPTVRNAQPKDGYDRDPGAGRGRLFHISADGALLGEVALGEGDAYHPGGIDFDGEFIWVPVAEYRPDSRAIIYRVDPKTLAAEPVLRAPDHIGAVAYDRRTRTLHGLSWGGRRFYAWRRDRAGRFGQPRVTVNRSSYVDAQDCHALGARRMLCSGVATYAPPAGAPPFSLGGWELVDLANHRQVWQAPVPLWAPSGRAMTQNPFFAAATSAGLRAWFMPDDDVSTIYVYDVAVP
jgi:hypothetical protein